MTNENDACFFCGSKEIILPCHLPEPQTLGQPCRRANRGTSSVVHSSTEEPSLAIASHLLLPIPILPTVLSDTTLLLKPKHELQFAIYHLHI